MPRLCAVPALLALLSAVVAPASCFRTNAGGICDASPASLERMVSTRHGPGSGLQGAFVLSAYSPTGAEVTVALGGVPYRGLVLAARDAGGARVGAFAGYPGYLEPQERCEGAPGSVLQHNNPDLKSPSLTVTWRGSGIQPNTTITFEAIVVVTTRDWYVPLPVSIPYGTATTPPTQLPPRPTVTPPPEPDPPARSFVNFAKSPWFFLMIWGVFGVLLLLAAATRAQEARLERDSLRQAVEVLWVKQQAGKVQ